MRGGGTHHEGHFRRPDATIDWLELSELVFKMPTRHSMDPGCSSICLSNNKGSGGDLHDVGPNPFPPLTVALSLCSDVYSRYKSVTTLLETTGLVLPVMP